VTRYRDTEPPNYWNTWKASARPCCYNHDGGKGRPRAQRLLTDMTDTQRRLFDLFELARYAPTR
jgi:hypothetical protein